MIVDLPPQEFELGLGSRVVTLGSCFAEGMGRRLAESLPDGAVAVNPMGALYSPASVCRALDMLVDGHFREDEYVFRGRDGMWHSWMHSADFSAATREVCVAKVAARFSEAARLLRAADVVCLTLGTAHTWWLKNGGEVVGNCHKELPATFETGRLTVAETAERMAETLERLHAMNPHARVVVTVSPYRYAKLGLHGSMLSKAVLHLATEELVAKMGFVCYFPAYEIVTDELRDYRFYDCDMAHPSAQAADYVWERFRAWCFTQELEDYGRDKMALLKAERHRPLTDDAAMLAALAEGVTQRRRTFHEKWDGRVAALGGGAPP